jgi:protein-arginine kinase activator protein McsA
VRSLSYWSHKTLESNMSELALQYFQLHWQSIPASDLARAKKSSKTKFTCPECGQNAWAKPDALLICGECYDEGEGDMCFMLAEQQT